MLIYMLPAIIVLGAVTAYQDYKEGIIRNKWIGGALAYALIVYSLLFIGRYLYGSLDSELVVQTLTNMIFSVVVGYGLYHFNLWSAGDGKLFIAFSWLIPITVYEVGYEPYVPSIIFFINCLILSTVVIFFTQIRRLHRRYVTRALRDTGREIIQPKRLLIDSVGLFVIQWLVQGLFSLFGFHSKVFSIALTVILFSQVSRMDPKVLVGVFMIGFARLVLDKTIYSHAFLADFLVILLVWKVLRSFFRGGLSRVAQEMSRKNIAVVDLQPGMFVCESITVKSKMTHPEFERLRKEWRTDVWVQGGVAYIKKERTLLQGGGILVSSPEGLTQRQAAWLQTLGFSHYRITKDIHFAPLLFIGVLVTIALRGNLLQVIFGMV